jgi:hypothetical protein
MLLWIFFYYLVPAILSSVVAYLSYRLIRGKSYDRWLFVFWLTLSWTPLIITSGHGVGIAQLAVALAFYKSGWLERTPIWVDGLAVLIVFLIVRRIIFKQKLKN